MPNISLDDLEKELIREISIDSEWIPVGQVSVDSGQLMIFDPSYLEGWKNTSYKDIRVYKDKETFNLYQFDGFGNTEKFHPSVKFFSSYEEEIEECDGKTPNILIHEEKRWEKIKYEPKKELSYNYVSHKHGNIIKNIMGLGICFDSGWGDGVYDIFAKMKDDKICEIKVVMC